MAAPSSKSASSETADRYLVTARKYRPKLFKELVAQEHVSDTLKNAIRLDRLAHAYLFSGPRGVGKTTAARILAKAINCTTPLEEREEKAEPCRECDSCKSFEEGRSLGIFEIDAASNNKVDDIRELRETVRVPPQGSKKKVYIIDEVHMLSNQAFNALLKTLEEPPAHVLFIFATTEPHKVLPTILSRCQRFDFRRIAVPAIVNRLEEICEAEGISADEESLMLLARKGDGALRDALSAFDQAVSLCGDSLKYGELTQAMGVVDIDLFFRLTKHAENGSSSGMLDLVNEVVQSGYDLQEFLTGLAEHLRNLLVAATMDDYSLIEAADSTRNRYAEHAERFSEADLLRLLMIAGDAESEVKSSSQPRLKLEMALLKMASLTRSADLHEAMQQIDWLQQAVKKGELPDTLPTAAPAGGHPESGASQEDDQDKQQGQSGTSRAKAPAAAPEQETSNKKEKQSTPPEPATQEKDAAKEDDVHEEPDSDDSGGDDSPLPGGAPEKKPAAREEEKVAGEPKSTYNTLFDRPALEKTERQSDGDNSGPSNAYGDGAATATMTIDQDGGTAVAAPPEDEALATEELEEQWEEFIQNVNRVSVRLGALLRRTQPRTFQSGTLGIAVPDPFHYRELNSEKGQLKEYLPEEISEPVDRLEFTVQNDLEEGDSQETTSEKDSYETLNEMRQDDPVVRAIFEKFGGEPVH